MKLFDNIVYASDTILIMQRMKDRIIIISMFRLLEVLIDI
jgi:hypothetical protein